MAIDDRTALSVELRFNRENLGDAKLAFDKGFIHIYEQRQHAVPKKYDPVPFQLRSFDRDLRRALKQVGFTLVADRALADAKRIRAARQST